MNHGCGFVGCWGLGFGDWGLSLSCVVNAGDMGQWVVVPILKPIIIPMQTGLALGNQREMSTNNMKCTWPT